MFSQFKCLGRTLVSPATRYSSSLTVYGHYISQPSRAVLWLLQIHDIPFDFKKIEPIRGETRTAEYKKMFPTGLIPGIDDGGFLMAEGPAILQYLCEKNDWTQWWPTGNDTASIQKRAKISEYLSHHHHSTRLISHKVIRPYMNEVFSGVPVVEGERPKRIQFAVKTLQKFGDVFLRDGPFVQGAQNPSIADLIAYGEIGQLVSLQILPSLDDVPAVNAWSLRMQKLPGHDDVHRSCVKLGDIFAKNLKA